METEETAGRPDGGQKIETSDTADSESNETYGILRVIDIILGAPIGLFEYGLVAGYPVATILYWNNAILPILPINELPLTGTLIDVLGVWTVIWVGVEICWVLVLSVDSWLAQPWS